MKKFDKADSGMELCYECQGGQWCIMCEGSGTITDHRCGFCGGGKTCIVCDGAGQLILGTYKDLVDRGLIKE